jgi:hypothetical protein
MPPALYPAFICPKTLMHSRTSNSEAGMCRTRHTITCGVLCP